MEKKQEGKLSGNEEERGRERAIERLNADLMPGLTSLFSLKTWTSCLSCASDFMPVEVPKLVEQHLRRIAGSKSVPVYRGGHCNNFPNWNEECRNSQNELRHLVSSLFTIWRKKFRETKRSWGGCFWNHTSQTIFMRQIFKDWFLIHACLEKFWILRFQRESQKFFSQCQKWDPKIEENRAEELVRKFFNSGNYYSVAGQKCVSSGMLISENEVLLL